MDNNVTIKNALKQYLKSSGLDALLRNKAVVKAWQKVAGREIATQTRIVGFNRGTLTVEVASSGLYAELNTFYLKDLASSIQSEMGNKKVRRIKLRLGEFVGEAGNVSEEKHSREKESRQQ